MSCDKDGLNMVVEGGFMRSWHEARPCVAPPRALYEYGMNSSVWIMGEGWGRTILCYRVDPCIPITSLRIDYLRTPTRHTYDLDRAWRPIQMHSISCLMAVENH